MIFGLKNLQGMEYIMIDGMYVYPDRNVSDIQYRTWKERLFSWPWRPFKKYINGETCYIIDNTAIVSPETYNKIKNRGSLR